MAQVTLSGRVASGIGRGRIFTGLDWARAQFAGKLGIDSYPGTLNVVIDDPDALTLWVRVKRSPGIRIENPGDGPNDCDARCYKVTLPGGIPAAIVWPEVEGYPSAQAELIAGVNLRERLGLEDGDTFAFDLARPPEQE